MEYGRLRGMPAHYVCLSVIYKSGLIKTSLSMRGKSPPGSHCVALPPPTSGRSPPEPAPDLFRGNAPACFPECHSGLVPESPLLTRTAS